MIEVEKECQDFLKPKIPNEYGILNNVKIIDYEGNISENIEILIYNKKNEECIYNDLIYLEAVSMVVKCNKNSENFEDELIRWSESIRDLKHKLENVFDEDNKFSKPLPIIALYGRENLSNIENFFHILLNKNGEICYSEILSNVHQVFYKLNYDGKTSNRSKEMIENLEIYKKMVIKKGKSKNIKLSDEISEILEMKIIEKCLNDEREKVIVNEQAKTVIPNIETDYIIGFHIDKIQNFLFSAINSHNNDSEKEELRQKMILNSSNEISNNFFKVIKEKFKDVNDEVILAKTSGKYIFGTNLTPDVIEKKCKEIFKEFYQNSNGLIFLLYTWNENEKNTNNKKKLDNCIEKLKSSKVYNNILERNAEFLFSLTECVSKNGNDSNNGKWKGFVKELDELNENSSENESMRSRICVVKADLDGMGELFKSLSNYEDYNVISKLLNNYISINKFDEYIIQQNKNIKVFPFYMAGDDIFIACRIEDIFKVIEILKDFLKELNKEIMRNLSVNTSLTMCIGIEITENKQPIRFFYERVEKQLEIAKKHKKNNKSIIIGFYNRYFTYYKWNILISQIAFIQSLKKKSEEEIKDAKIITTTYLYNFYNRLLGLYSDNLIKFKNLFFYEIFPEYIGDNNKKKYRLDTSLKSFIFLNSYKDGKVNKEFVENLKLIILFLDKRYRVELNLSDYYIINKKYHFYSEVKKNFLKKVLEEIFSNHFCGNTDLRDQFLKREGQIDKANYRLLNRVGISTLFRIKREILNERKDVKKIKKMLINISEKKNEVDIQKKATNQRPNISMYFSFDENYNIKDTELTTDFIDSVIIFYKYRMAYKIMNEKN